MRRVRDMIHAGAIPLGYRWDARLANRARRPKSGMNRERRIPSRFMGLRGTDTGAYGTRRASERLCRNLDFQDFAVAQLAIFAITENPAKTNVDKRLPVKDARRTNPENPIIP